MSSTSLVIRINSVKKLFLARNIKVNHEWISDCIEFFLSEDQGITDRRLFEKAMEQWILNDISEVAEGCLPASVEQNKDMFYLTGKYVLQMQYIIDISEPAYDQLRTLYNKQLDEAEDEIRQREPVKKKRMLKMELTDGVRKLIAMEHRPIPQLNTKLTPGMKIGLSGSMKCCNKVVFLDAANVEILGGEVDTLLIENAFENMLLKSLGKPINPEPKLGYDDSKSISESTSAGQEAQQSRVIPPVRTAGNVDLPDDDLFMDIDLNEIATVNIPDSPPAQRSVAESRANPPARNIFEMSEDPFMDSEIFNNIETELDQEPLVVTVNSNILISCLSEAYEFRIRGCNLVTIEQLNKLKNNDKKDKLFIVKASIDAVAEKLKVTDSEFKLGVFLQDKYSDQLLQVRFQSQVLSQMAKYSPDELKQMKREMVNRPDIKDDIMSVLDNLKKSIESLDSFLKIQFTYADELPFIVELIESNNHLEDILSRKCIKEEIRRRS